MTTASPLQPIRQQHKSPDVEAAAAAAASSAWTLPLAASLEAQQDQADNLNIFLRKLSFFFPLSPCKQPGAAGQVTQARQ